MRRFGKKSSEAPISDVPNFIKLEAPEQGAIPRIHFDISFGEKVLNFDADVEKIAEQMRSEGLSEETISNTNIHFTDKTPIRTTPSGVEIVTGGDYNRQTDEINVYLSRDIHEAAILNYIDEMRSELLGDDDRPDRQDRDDELSDRLNRTLLHEVRHAGQRAKSPRMNRFYEIKHHAKRIGVGSMPLVGINFGGAEALQALEAHNLGTSLALGVLAAATMMRTMDRYEKKVQHKVYTNSPSEVDARLAEENSTIGSLVSIEIDYDSKVSRDITAIKYS